MADSEPDVVVVVPTYNERPTLPILIARLLALPVANLRVLVVDDNSPDGTGEQANDLARRHSAVSVLHRERKDGLGRAYVAGMTRALASEADVVIQMDADLSHDPAAIPRLVAALDDSGAGVVLGSRYVLGGESAADWPWSRRLLSRWANAYVNAILRLGVRDATSGFKAWHADTLRAVDLTSIRSSGYAFQIEMNHRALALGFRLAEVPIVFADRAHGSSKMTVRVQLESALAPWRVLMRRRGPGVRPGVASECEHAQPTTIAS